MDESFQCPTRLSAVKVVVRSLEANSSTSMSSRASQTQEVVIAARATGPGILLKAFFIIARRQMVR
jgi:hypothetical protein